MTIKIQVSVNSTVEMELGKRVREKHEMMEEEIMKMAEAKTDRLNQNGIEMIRILVSDNFIEEMVLEMKMKEKNEMMGGETIRMDEMKSEK